MRARKPDINLARDETVQTKGAILSKITIYSWNLNTSTNLCIARHQSPKGPNRISFIYRGLGKSYLDEIAGEKIHL